MCGAGRVSDGLPGQDEWGRKVRSGRRCSPRCVRPERSSPDAGPGLELLGRTAGSGGLSSVALDHAQLRHHDYETREASEQAAGQGPGSMSELAPAAVRRGVRPYGARAARW
jgi:hypothetical protein